jgi:hypothetical protein
MEAADMRFRRHPRVVIVVFGILAGFATWPSPSRGQQIPTYTTQKIWSDGLYNTFTDVTQFDGRWYVAFRASTTHGIPPAGQPGGSVRVLQSDDGQTWTTAALLSDGGDLRDPKLLVTPANQLMVMAGSLSQTEVNTMQSYAWFSNNGSTWSAPQTIGDPNYWLWRGASNNGTVYAVGYGPIDGNEDLRLYTSSDGTNFQTLASNLTNRPEHTDVTETGLVFLRNGTAVMLARETSGYTLIGTSTGDYTDWNFVDTHKVFESPDLIELPDGRIVAAGRMYKYINGKLNEYTSLSWLDPIKDTLKPFLELPATTGDAGYPGLAWVDNELWVSYHSQVGTGSVCDIYLAQVAIPLVAAEPATLALLASGLVLVGSYCWWRRRFRAAKV